MSKNIILDGNTFSGISEVELPIEGGTAKFRDEDEIVTPNGEIRITANGSYDVSDKETVVVAVECDAELESKTVTPTAAGFTVTAGEGFDGLSSVIVNGDNNLVAGNIKEGVNIFGVLGTLASGAKLENKTVCSVIEYTPQDDEYLVTVTCSFKPTGFLVLRNEPFKSGDDVLGLYRCGYFEILNGETIQFGTSIPKDNSTTITNANYVTFRQNSVYIVDYDEMTNKLRLSISSSGKNMTVGMTYTIILFGGNFNE